MSRYGDAGATSKSNALHPSKSRSGPGGLTEKPGHNNGELAERKAKRGAPWEAFHSGCAADVQRVLWSLTRRRLLFFYYMYVKDSLRRSIDASVVNLQDRSFLLLL